MGSGHFMEEAAEEFMEALYTFWERDPKERVRTKQLAEHLGISPPSVTGMVQRLAKRGWVDHIPYHGVAMSDDGLIVARQVKRRHRLVECLLMDVLGFQGDIHEAACRLEHAINADLEWTIAELLGHPDRDPSGKPIPAMAEDLNLSYSPDSPHVCVLTAMKDDSEATIMALLDAKDALVSLGLSPGVSVSRRDGHWWVGENKLVIDLGLAMRVLVRPIL